MSLTAGKPLSAPRQAGHVLIVDDDTFMLELMSDMLHDLGIEKVSTATDGMHGFQIIESAILRPNIIICDLHMPNRDGFQLMELLAEKEYRCSVILVSGMAPRFINSAALMGRLHHLNVLGTLHKPFEKSALAALLAKAETAH